MTNRFLLRSFNSLFVYFLLRRVSGIFIWSGASGVRGDLGLVREGIFRSQVLPLSNGVGISEICKCRVRLTSRVLLPAACLKRAQRSIWCLWSFPAVYRALCLSLSPFVKNFLQPLLIHGLADVVIHTLSAREKSRWRKKKVKFKTHAEREREREEIERKERRQTDRQRLRDRDSQHKLTHTHTHKHRQR